MSAAYLTVTMLAAVANIYAATNDFRAACADGRRMMFVGDTGFRVRVWRRKPALRSPTNCLLQNPPRLPNRQGKPANGIRGHRNAEVFGGTYGIDLH